GWLTATHLESILRILNAQLGSATGGVNIYLPSDWMWSDFFLVCSVSLLLSFLVTIYPSRKASLISPALILNGS
ncbi:MAG: hypothetical protein KDI30_04900, partial [Pseudomonadales bacterium]|nr:hypothetical protein [Pseudomonadales bacterium]